MDKVMYDKMVMLLAANAFPAPFKYYGSVSTMQRIT